MLLELAINFCILFTFTVLSYWPFQNHVQFKMPYPRFHPLIIGLMSGFAGLVLMKTSIPISEDIFVDARTVVIVISGVFGGPAATFTSALIIGVGRFFFDGATTPALIAGLNVISVGLIISMLLLRKPMTFRSAPYYFYYFTFQTTIVLAFLMGVSWDAILHITYFIIYSIVSFFTVLLILRELNVHFGKIGQLEALSETDYLTGLNNNRKFQEIAGSFSATDQGPYSILVLDIDHFKKVNDTYGHPIGDEILLELAVRLKKSVTPLDGFVSRNGGEEFSIILPKLRKEQALEAAEKIRKAVAEEPFVTSTHLSLPLTVSIGISSAPENGYTVKELYNQADTAMYKAKHNGRNRAIHINNAM